MTQSRFYSSTTKATTTTADPGGAGTTLTVADSTVFASLDGQFPYTLAINWGLADQELVNVTARPTGTTLTIVRGQDGTAGVAHPVGATVTHDVSARDFNEASAHVGASTGVHGLAGSVVGTSDTQTLSNKTLTGLTTSYVTKTGAYTLTSADAVVGANASSAAFTLTLPTAVGATGRTYIIKKTDSSVNTVTIATTSSQTIEGSTTFVMSTPNLSVQVVSDGSNWQIIDIWSTDPWHMMSLQNGWINSSGKSAAKYRMVAPNNIQVLGCIEGGDTTGGTVIAMLPAGYRPNIAVTASQPVYTNKAISSMPVMWMESSGALKIFNIPAFVSGSAVQVQFNIFFPVDG